MLPPKQSQEDYTANYISEVVFLQHLALKTVSLTYLVFLVLHMWVHVCFTQTTDENKSWKNAFKQHIIANIYFVHILLGLITPQMGSVLLIKVQAS